MSAKKSVIVQAGLFFLVVVLLMGGLIVYGFKTGDIKIYRTESASLEIQKIDDVCVISGEPKIFGAETQYGEPWIYYLNKDGQIIQNRLEHGKNILAELPTKPKCD